MIKIEKQVMFIYSLAITVLILFSCNKEDNVEDAQETEDNVSYIEFTINNERYFQEYKTGFAYAYAQKENNLQTTKALSEGDGSAKLDINFNLTTYVTNEGQTPLGDSTSPDLKKDKTFIYLNLGDNQTFASKYGYIIFSKYKDYGNLGVEIEANFQGDFQSTQSNKLITVTNGKIRINKFSDVQDSE